MKKSIQKITTWLLAVCMVIGFIPAFGSAAAAEDQSIQSVGLTGSKTDLLADPVFAVRNTALRANEPADAELPPAMPPAEEPGESNTGGLAAVFQILLKAIGVNLRSISVSDVLKLPANVMDDVLTYIFGVIKLLGINIDSLYTWFSSVFLK